MIIIDGYTIDVALSEEPVFDSEVTQYPVEQGAELIDHVQVKPVTLRIDGIISDTPIGDALNARNLLSRVGNADKHISDEGYARLREIFDKREPVTVETPRAVFENMILQNLSTPSVSNDGDMLHFNATFMQITFSQAKRETVVFFKGDLGHKALTKAQFAAYKNDLLNASKEKLDWINTSLNTPHIVAKPEGFGELTILNIPE